MFQAKRHRQGQEEVQGVGGVPPEHPVAQGLAPEISRGRGGYRRFWGGLHRHGGADDAVKSHGSDGKVASRRSAINDALPRDPFSHPTGATATPLPAPSSAPILPKVDRLKLPPDVRMAYRAMRYRPRVAREPTEGTIRVDTGGVWENH